MRVDDIREPRRAVSKSLSPPRAPRAQSKTTMEFMMARTDAVRRRTTHLRLIASGDLGTLPSGLGAVPPPASASWCQWSSPRVTDALLTGWRTYCAPPIAFSTSASVIIIVIGSTGEAANPAFS